MENFGLTLVLISFKEILATSDYSDNFEFTFRLKNNSSDIINSVELKNILFTQNNNGGKHIISKSFKMKNQNILPNRFIEFTITDFNAFGKVAITNSMLSFEIDSITTSNSEYYIEKLIIKEFRKLHNIQVLLGKNRHLVLTGKNGSGKTTLLKEILIFLANIQSGSINTLISYYNQLEDFNDKIKNLKNLNMIEQVKNVNYSSYYQNIQNTSKNIENFQKKVNLEFNILDGIYQKFQNGNFILAFYAAKRETSMNKPDGVRNITLSKSYGLDAKVSSQFIQYLVNMKTRRSFARDEGNHKEAGEIDKWFEKIERLFKMIFDDEKLKLSFDYRNFNFTIQDGENQIFDFKSLSDGYSAIINIVTDLLLRMENNNSGAYDIQGVVLIDEIETHLHVDLQKKILPFLTEFFPKIQFIVTTHSPFVLSSLSNTVIFDLENQIEVQDLSKYSYEGIIESYFGIDKYSKVAKEKIQEYEKLINSQEITDEILNKIYDIEDEFSNPPPYLSKELMIAFYKLKSERMARNGQYNKD